MIKNLARDHTPIKQNKEPSKINKTISKIIVDIVKTRGYIG